MPTISAVHLSGMETVPFEHEFTEVFNAQYPKLFRILDRLTGEADVADDLAQEAFVRLYRRRSMPDAPAAWLVSVAMNLFRNVATATTRRQRLISVVRAEHSHADPAAPTDAAAESGDVRARVRAALERLSERDRSLLLLRAEGYRYSEIAAALKINPASIGTLIARAEAAFRAYHQGTSNAR